MPLMLTLIVLIDQVSNLDEHLYLLLGISRLQKLGQERLRLPIQKPCQINIYIKPEKNEYHATSRRLKRNLHEAVCRRMQTN